MLKSSNISITHLDVRYTGVTKNDEKQILEILHPRKVKRKASKRKNLIDKSWERLQTVLTAK